jgi:MOSC domain-containing protein YiiM
VDRVAARAGRGLAGDRYYLGVGTFSSRSGRDLTLIEAETLEQLQRDGVALTYEAARRNVVTRGLSLDELIGRRFRIGEVECIGQGRAEPCAHLERLTKPGVLRALVHRGGLRADILTDGEIVTGAEIRLA